MIIACGQRTKAVAMAVRRRYGAFSVFIHTLSSSELSSFDAMICGEHDKLSGDKILSIIGAVGGIRKSDIDARRASALKKFAAVPTPRVAVLVGGANRAFSFSADDCRTLSDSVIAAVGPGGVLATPSRRTGAPGKSELIKTFAEKVFVGMRSAKILITTYSPPPIILLSAVILLICSARPSPPPNRFLFIACRKKTIAPPQSFMMCINGWWK